MSSRFPKSSRWTWFAKCSAQSIVGMHYTDDLIILDITFIQGRPKGTRLALLKDINTRIAAAAGVSPDDMLITL